MARILMIVRPSEGGAFEHVSSLSAGVEARGHEVILCGPHAHRSDELPVEVIPLDIVRPIAPVADLRAVAGLSHVIRRVRPDLVHAHGSKGGVMARTARLPRMRTPLVLTPHGYAFAGHFSSRAERGAYRGLERILSPLASRVICVCEAEARLARSVGPDRRVRVVHNGIEPPGRLVADPAVTALRADGPLICAITGLRPGKGVETLLAALPTIVERHPGSRLVVAGGGAERDALIEVARALGVSDSLHLIGEVEDPFGVLAASDLFVNPSWAESFPYAVIEAMAAGLPIVATDVGGVSEAIEDGVTGLLVPPRSPEALARATVCMLDDAAAARALGTNAARTMRERFTLSSMVEGTLAVYRELIDFRG